MQKTNHIFSFPGGDMLAQMTAWWFVSYTYYLRKDRTHFNWRAVKSESTRRAVYNKTREYHVYWLTEVLDMQNLDVHGNSGNLTSGEVKKMAKELLDTLSKDGGATEIQRLIDRLQAQYDRVKQSK